MDAGSPQAESSGSQSLVAKGSGELLSLFYCSRKQSGQHRARARPRVLMEPRTGLGTAMGNIMPLKAVH